MRLTIERLRTLVLVAAFLLLVATAGFLALDKWKNPFNRRDMPRKLGFDIQQESDGVTFSHALGSHSQFKIHASKVVQLKQGNALLHDVKIELYSEDGKRVDRIEGNEFEYSQKDGTATASGPVSMTLTRPGTAPAIAPKMSAKQIPADKNNPLNAAARAAAAGRIDVKTSGLVFNWNTGVAATGNRVDFSSVQGAGSSQGATYDSKAGRLVLERDVDLRTLRNGETAEIRAGHAEFEKDNLICLLRAASASYRQGTASAGEAKIEFRENGSASRLEATGGFRLTSARGGTMVAPRGTLDFDEHSQPHHGRMDGGVVADSSQPGRNVHGTAPSADLEFSPKGDLRRVHLERNVELKSSEENRTAGAHPETVRMSRSWRSPVAEIDFRNAGGKVEPSALRGLGGVVVVSRSQRGAAAPVLDRLAADQVNGSFGANASLSRIVGTGHASMEQTTVSGARQTANGERLEANFGLAANHATELQSAVLDGNVVVMQTRQARPGAPAQPPLRAFAGHASYTSEGEWLHLSVNPRIDDGGLQLTANRVDLSQSSGDAFAHGNVKATWLQNAAGASGKVETPAHVIAAEAQVHQANGNSIATFRGHARMWQAANTVTAPTIVLEKNGQTLEARSNERAEPVRVVMLNDARAAGKSKNGMPQVLRAHGGELHYSGANRTVLMRSGSLGPVVAETGTATSQSEQVELKLAPAGKTEDRAREGQVERMIARGHVVLSSGRRRGTGEQLVYTGATGEYVLTGTATAPPRMSDPERGSVTGAALIFRNRDDSVSIEGGGRPTTTQTTAPR